MAKRSSANGNGASESTTIEHRKIADLTPDPINANKGTERGLSMLDDSLSVVGLGRSIVTDKNGIIIAGNKTTERAIDRGFEDAVVVHTNGDRLVVVQRDDLDSTSDDPNNPARKLAYYDNRVGQLDLQWDAEQLLADVNAGFDFEHLFSENELNNLLRANEVFDPMTEWQGMPEFEQEEIAPFKTIHVHFENEEAVLEFAKRLGQTVTLASTFIWFPAKPDERLKGKIEWVGESEISDLHPD